MASERRVTGSRTGRLGLLGRLAGGIAGSVVGEGVRRVARGQRPTWNDLLLTPANARRLADGLSEMRGAAMKLGQLMSMDSGQVLPPQLSEVLARLREDAHQMPLGQVAEVLRDGWGRDWEANFSRFQFTPIAAASIGQVHEAVLKDGRRLAIKVQYPGIRDSIDSDVDNVAMLLRMVRVLPDDFDIGPVLEEAKRQLHVEADYQTESASLLRFAAKLEGNERFQVPEPIEALSTRDILTMQFLDGHPIERLADQPSALRNSVAASLTELALREVFDWGLVQTDPNFANYLYAPGTNRIQLLDFGATRDYPQASRSALCKLLAACSGGSDDDLADAAAGVGYLADREPAGYRRSVVGLLRTATEPLRAAQPFAFGGSDMARRMRDAVLEMRLRDGFGRLPPTEVLYLHRKLGGLYLLLARLRAVVDVRALVTPYLEPAQRRDAMNAQQGAA
jgi:predicted unusual protein kinase regulating ubiquinone biosynthesis (AarF/ABC1/UbiB family)